MLEVGRIDKAHGLWGEVIVTLTTDRVERLDPGSVLSTDAVELVVVSSARHQRRWRVQFDGYNSRESADALRGQILRAEPLDDPSVWFVHELIGATVVTTKGVAVGTTVAVIDNPVHDLLELDTGALVPLPFVVDADMSAQPVRVVIDPPEGLLELHETEG